MTIGYEPRKSYMLLCKLQLRFVTGDYTLVWLPVSVGALDLEYARLPCQLNGKKFFVSGRT